MTLEKLQKRCIAALIVLGDVQISDRHNFFKCGLDSVKILDLVTSLRSSFSAGKKFFNPSLFSPRTIYRNPSVEDLSTAVLKLVSTSPEKNEIGSWTASRREIELLIEHYTNNLLRRESKKLTDAPKTRLNVALTGSTGSLGGWICDAYLRIRVLMSYFV